MTDSGITPCPDTIEPKKFNDAHLDIPKTLGYNCAGYKGIRPESAGRVFSKASIGLYPINGGGECSGCMLEKDTAPDE